MHVAVTDRLFLHVAFDDFSNFVRQLCQKQSSKFTLPIDFK